MQINSLVLIFLGCSVASDNVDGSLLVSPSMPTQCFGGIQIVNLMDSGRGYAGEGRGSFSVSLPVYIYHKSDLAGAPGVRRVITVGFTEPSRAMLPNKLEGGTSRTPLNFFHFNLKPGYVQRGFAGRSAAEKGNGAENEKSEGASHGNRRLSGTLTKV